MQRNLSSVQVTCIFLTVSTLFLSSAHATESDAASNETRIISRINGPTTFDGMSDKAVCEEIAPIKVMPITPNYGDLYSEKTEILIAYDNRYRHVA